MEQSIGILYFENAPCDVTNNRYLNYFNLLWLTNWNCTMIERNAYLRTNSQRPSLFSELENVTGIPKGKHDITIIQPCFTNSKTAPWCGAWQPFWLSACGLCRVTVSRCKAHCCVAEPGCCSPLLTTMGLQSNLNKPPRFSFQRAMLRSDL